MSVSASQCLSLIVPGLIWLTLHLDQELCLDATSGLALIVIPGATEGVHVVDEDDGGFVLASQIKQVLHQPVGHRNRWRKRRMYKENTTLGSQSLRNKVKLLVLLMCSLKCVYTLWSFIKYLFSCSLFNIYCFFIELTS